MGTGRRIGFREAFSIGVGGMIGGGIFAVLGLSLELAGTAAPLAFLLAGLIALVTAYSYAKLSLRFPSRGGTVEFLVQGFGPGVFSGGLNILLLASYVVMVALYSYAFGSYGASIVHGGWLLSHVLASLVVLAFVFVNALGAYVSGSVEDALVFFKLGVLVLVAAVGLPLVSWAKFSPSKWPSALNIVVGGMIIFLAYEGFELIANTAADVESPSVLPRAFYSSVLVVIAVYVVIALVSAGVLSPEEVIRVRDYALAEVAAKGLGYAGFLLVVAAALASTASAINATLYGTAGISYIVAKYGQLPRELGKKIWRNAPEGLVAIAVLSLLLVNTTGLETISFAGSCGFLLVFGFINIAAYRLRDRIRANPVITIIGAGAAFTALGIMIYRSIVKEPLQAALFAVTVTASFTIEYVYRLYTRRELAEYIDELLRAREEAIRQWDKWVPRIIQHVAERLKAVEIYLVGSVAREELHRAHDVDLLVVSKERLTKKQITNLIRELREKGIIEKHHPIDIHVAVPDEKEKWLQHSKKYRRLYRRETSGAETGK